MHVLFDNPVSCLPHPCDKEKGIQLVYEYANGYGASVVRFRTPNLLGFKDQIRNGYGSYTRNEDEWELAVTYHGHLCYETPITNDVVGYINAAEVEQILQRIKSFPSKTLYQKLYFAYQRFADEVSRKRWYYCYLIKRWFNQLKGVRNGY
jgi:hypothetical protein